MCAFCPGCSALLSISHPLRIVAGGEQHSLAQPYLQRLPAARFTPPSLSRCLVSILILLLQTSAICVATGHPRCTTPTPVLLRTSLSWNGAWSAPAQPSSGRASTLILWHKQYQNSRARCKSCVAWNITQRPAATQEPLPLPPTRAPSSPPRPAERFNVASSAGGQTTTRSCQLDAQIIHLARGPLTGYSATTANTAKLPEVGSVDDEPPVIRSPKQPDISVPTLGRPIFVALLRKRRPPSSEASKEGFLPPLFPFHPASPLFRSAPSPARYGTQIELYTSPSAS